MKAITPKTRLAISIKEVEFDKRTQADVFRAISDSIAARSKCADAQKNGDKPRQAELHINETHVANIAVWGGGDFDSSETIEDFFNSPDEEVYGIPTKAWWDVWAYHKDELKSRGMFVEKDSTHKHVIGRFK